MTTKPDERTAATITIRFNYSHPHRNWKLEVNDSDGTRSPQIDASVKQAVDELIRLLSGEDV